MKEEKTMKKAIVALVVALFVLPMAFAELCTDTNIICASETGGASISATSVIAAGSGDIPVIKYAWILPDESPTAGTQLMPALSAVRNNIYACVVVYDPDGRDNIGFVYADVYHPADSGSILPCVLADGTLCDNSGTGQPWSKTTLFKYQAHAERLDPTDDETEIEQCKIDAMAAGLLVGTPLTGQAAYDDIDHFIFVNPGYYMYKVSLPMLYHQPAGIYTVRFWATDKESHKSAEVVRNFEWLSAVALEIDFGTSLNYGNIQPSASDYKVIMGDYNILTTPTAPTVKNEGNERIKIEIQSTALTGVTYGKKIETFDVKWNPHEINNLPTKPYAAGLKLDVTGLTWQMPIPGDPNHTTEVGPFPLELCQTEKIDFSVHADLGLAPDTYTGSMKIWATAFDS